MKGMTIPPPDERVSSNVKTAVKNSLAGLNEIIIPLKYFFIPTIK
jgi:hypothetical protein